MRRIKHAKDVEMDHVMPIRRIAIFNAGLGASLTRIGEDCIQSTEMGYRLADTVFQRIPVGHIAGNRQRRIANFIRQRFQFIF